MPTENGGAFKNHFFCLIVITNIELPIITLFDLANYLFSTIVAPKTDNKKNDKFMLRVNGADL